MAYSFQDSTPPAKFHPNPSKFPRFIHENDVPDNYNNRRSDRLSDRRYWLSKDQGRLLTFTVGYSKIKQRVQGSKQKLKIYVKIWPLSVQCNLQHWTEYKFTLASVRPSVRPSVDPSGVRPDGNYGQHCEPSFGPIFTKFGTQLPFNTPYKILFGQSPKLEWSGSRDQVYNMATAAVLNKKLSYRLETGRQQCISL